MNIRDKLRSKKTSLGIDLGTSSIKIVELKRTKGEIHLNRYGIVDKTWSGSLTDKAQIAGQTTKQYLKDSQIKTKDVYLAIKGSQVITRQLILPNIPEKELNKVLYFEFQKHISFPMDEIVFDYFVLDKDKKNLVVLIIGVKKELAYAYHEFCEAAGLALISLEIESLSMLRLLSFGDQKNGSSVIIDSSYNKSTILFTEQGRYVFSRCFSIDKLRTDSSMFCNQISMEVSRTIEYLSSEGIMFKNPPSIFYMGSVLGERKNIDIIKRKLGWNLVQECLEHLIKGMNSVPHEHKMIIGIAIGLSLRRWQKLIKI